MSSAPEQCDVEKLISRSLVPVHGLDPNLTAREQLGSLEADAVLLERGQSALVAVNSLVEISRTNVDGSVQEIDDLLNLDQIIEIDDTLQSYLGTDVPSHLARPGKPVNYAAYVERLSGYFSLSDSLITSNFSSFEKRHSDPSPHATGPLEVHSRHYALEATDIILRQFESYYRAELDIRFKGPTKMADNGLVWERGIAECHFLVLDFVRNAIARGGDKPVNSAVRTHTMTIEDIGASLSNLIVHRDEIVAQTRSINPILGEQIGDALDSLHEHTKPVLHRGRMGTPRYQREPRKAETAINRIASLAVIAANLEAETRADQQDIPVIDL